MSWRLARALVTMRNQVNAKYPGRDTGSDGTIGDAAHATRSSDHNPWVVVDGVGVVRAWDCDKDGIDAAWFAEQVRLAGAAGDRRLNPGGYVIYNRRIAGAHTGWAWRVYTGTNPHTSHVHVSYSTDRAGFDSAESWAFLAASPAPQPSPAPAPQPAPAPSGRPTIRRGSTGQAVKDLQTRLRTSYPLYAKAVTSDGIFGPKTEAAVREFQRRAGIGVDGIVGPITWRRLGF